MALENGFYIEILNTYANPQTWGKMRPTNGPPYRKNTLEDARFSAKHCYPFTSIEFLRIVQVVDGVETVIPWQRKDGTCIDFSKPASDGPPRT